MSFQDSVFDFVFDMGCFHHVEVEDRPKFIEGFFRVLRKEDVYMLTGFNYKNSSAWNPFTRQQITDLFSSYFEIKEIRHYPSIEGDG